MSATAIMTHIVCSELPDGEEDVLQVIEGRHDLARGTLVTFRGVTLQVSHSELVLGNPAVLKVFVA